MTDGAARRRVGWIKDSIRGMEFAEVDLREDRLSARVVAIAGEPVAYRLDYTLETEEGFVTHELHLVTVGDGWRRSLELTRTAFGRWDARATSEGTTDLPPAGGDPAAIDGALDCDVAYSPVTNSMPVLRDGLLAGPRSHEYLMAWVSVPDLAFQASRQRYVSPADVPATHVVGYESLDGDFTADLTFDPDGLVIDYPQLARRLR